MFNFLIQAAQPVAIDMCDFADAFENSEMQAFLEETRPPCDSIIRLFRIAAASADPKDILTERVTHLTSHFSGLPDDVIQDLRRCCDRTTPITKDDLRFLADLHHLGEGGSNIMTVFSSSYGMFVASTQQAGQAFNTSNFKWLLETLYAGHQQVGVTHGNLLDRAEPKVKVQKLKDAGFDRTLTECVGNADAADHALKELAHLMTTRNYNDLDRFLPMLVQYAQHLEANSLTATDMLSAVLRRHPEGSDDWYDLIAKALKGVPYIKLSNILYGISSLQPDWRHNRVNIDLLLARCDMPWADRELRQACSDAAWIAFVSFFNIIVETQGEILAEVIEEAAPQQGLVGAIRGLYAMGLKRVASQAGLATRGTVFDAMNAFITERGNREHLQKLFYHLSAAAPTPAMVKAQLRAATAQ